MPRRSISVALLLSMVGSGCAVVGEEEAADTDELALETCDVRLHSMDASLDVESLLHILVPAANVEAYVPAPFQILRVADPLGGGDRALLWVLAGDINSITTDGVAAGPLLSAHLFVQIQEPTAPAGYPNTLGAVHLYELELILNNKTVVDWFVSNLDGSTYVNRQMTVTRVAPGLLPGIFQMNVGGNPQYGQFTYHVEYPLLLSGPAPVVHGWWRRDKGLVRWDPVMTGEVSLALDGEVCTEDGTRLRQIFGTRCRTGTGFVTSIDVASTYKNWPCL
jgi:hypothetical protein